MLKKHRPLLNPFLLKQDHRDLHSFPTRRSSDRRDGDPDETSSVEETPATSEPITSQAGPSGETGEPTVQSGTSFQADLEEQIRKFKAIQRGTIPEGTESIAIGPTFTLTEPVISRVRAPPLEEPVY